MQHTLTLTAPYTILPGSLGGVLSNLALAGNTVYVATVDQRFKLAKMSYPLGAQDGSGSGEIVALNLTTGKAEWDTKVRPTRWVPPRSPTTSSSPPCTPAS